MKKVIALLVCVAMVAICVEIVNAQPPRERERGPGGKGIRGGPPGGPPGEGPGGRRGGKGRGPGGKGMGGGPLMRVLDTDRDGELSEKEIDAAPRALRTLDTNNDGKLTRDEIFPRGRGRGRGRGKRGGPGGPGKRRGGSGGPPPPGQ